VQALLTLVEQLPPALIYLVAALLVAAETALIFGLVLPAEATLLLVGFLAYLGTLRLLPALLVMTVAALAGDFLAWRAGRRYGPRVRASRVGRRVGDHRWDRGHSMLRRMGGRGVLVARWIAFIRTLVPRLAGSAGMPYREFAPWNAVGVVTWVCTSVLIGYLAGTSYEEVSERLGRATGAVLAFVGCVLLIVLVGRWLGRNPDPTRALLARTGLLPALRWLRRRHGALYARLSLHIGAGWALVINMVIGLALLFVGSLGLIWLVSALVDYSGLSELDVAIARSLRDHAASDVDSAATAIVTTARGSVLTGVVALVALFLGWRYHAWQNRAWRDEAGRADLVTMLGTVGAFLPLVLLAIAARVLPQADADDPAGRSVLPTPGSVEPFETARLFGAGPVVTASLCTLAWLVARYVHWPWAVTAWTGAAAGTVLIVGARVYLGWSYASEAVTSVLIGVLWTAVFMVAWTTRDHTTADDPDPPDRTRKP
jgi:undecaprenyl-diphosphatase